MSSKLFSLLQRFRFVEACFHFGTKGIQFVRGAMNFQHAISQRMWNSSHNTYLYVTTHLASGVFQQKKRLVLDLTMVYFLWILIGRWILKLDSFDQIPKSVPAISLFPNHVTQDRLSFGSLPARLFDLGSPRVNCNGQIIFFRSQSTTSITRHISLQNPFKIRCMGGKTNLEIIVVTS